MELAPAPPLPTDRCVQQQRQANDDDGEQAFSEHSQGHAGVAAVPAPRFAIFERSREAVECSRDEETQNGFRDQDACEEVTARGCDDEESGIDSGAATE